MTVEPPRMRDERVAAIHELLMETVREEPARRRHRRRRAALVWGITGALVVGAGATGAAVVLQAASVTDTRLVHCLSSTSRNADGSYPGSAATLTDGSGHTRNEDAIAICSEMWRQGVLEPRHDPLSVGSTGTVPARLTVCVMDDGSAAVVPGAAGSCRALGLAPLKPERGKTSP